jgi:peptidoglycan/LPS O-acetylase OafA/YrhL
MSSTSARNQEIEALRCFAVLIVVVGHSHNLLRWHDGLANTTIGLWTGVDVFLCISGFVITRTFGDRIREAAQSGREALRLEIYAFLLRRIFRLIPAAWLWIFLAFIFSIFFNKSGSFGSPAQNLQDAAAIVMSVANFYFSACTTGPLTGCGPNGIYWTVSLEQQFYLLFPALILLRRDVLIVLCVIIIVFFALVTRTIWIWFNRVDPIALGILLALTSKSPFYSRLEPRFLAHAGARFLSTTLLLGSLLVIPSILAQNGMFYRSPMIITPLCGVLVFVASFNRGYLFGQGTLLQVLAYVGERSYSIYLLHNLSMALAHEILLRVDPSSQAMLGPDYDFLLVLLAIVILSSLTELSYRFVEVPFRNYGATMARSLRVRSSSSPALTLSERSI